ncbi:MAG: hypothetical protein O2955_06185 [Planctomycetota bacterium]|nr:hypothetical protein [Planctomycetota bacterium]MDA1212083.1 hypothetical protein [Planctomycetota bacterium]
MRSLMKNLAICLVLLASTTAVALACPFCSAPSLTLSEQVAQADVVVLVQWTDAVKGNKESAGATTYEVLDIVRAPQAGAPKKGEKIELVRYRAGKEGDLFVLLGTKTGKLEWGSPLDVSEASYEYIKLAPSPELPIQKRLAYFLKYLEYPDLLVANDAYAEFANAPYHEIAALTDEFPREKLREWITSQKVQTSRLGLYGLLLGLSGNEDDAELMEKTITAPSEEFRLGIDGIIGGYLLLKGEPGLEIIESSKLRDKTVPFSETYAAMQALRFMWQYGDEKISHERLRESMRILLDRPELADLVIADLARWKDWNSQERLAKLYGAEEYNIPSIKRAIVRFLLVSTKDIPKPTIETKAKDNEDVAVASAQNGKTNPTDKDESATPTELPKHVVRGEKLLDEIRKKDPKTVSEVERFFFVK